MRLDQQNGMAHAHPGMHRRRDPFPIGGPARVIEVMEVGAVLVWLDFAGGQIAKAHSFGVIINDIELRIFLWQEADDLAVGAPKLLARVVNQFLAILPVAVHDTETANSLTPFALVNGKRDVAAVGRSLGVVLVLLGG